MNSASKLNVLSTGLLASLMLLFLYLNKIIYPPFLEGKNDTLLFGHGVTFSESGAEKYREIHTLDHRWSGMHQINTTYNIEDNTRNLNVSSSVYFWTPTLFSTSNTTYSEGYKTSVERDSTQAHLIIKTPEEYFQTIYQDTNNFCYSSLLTGSIQCITAAQ